MKTLAKSKKKSTQKKRRPIIVDKKATTPFDNKSRGYNFVNSKATKLIVVILTLSMTLGIVIGAIVAIINQ